MNPRFGDSSPASSTDASPSSSSTPPKQSATPPWTLTNWLFVILLVSLGGLLPLGAVLWAKHREGQITHVEDLGLARDFQWLGASDGHWLLRTPAGGWLTLDGSRRGWAMEPDAFDSCQTPNQFPIQIKDRNDRLQHLNVRTSRGAHRSRSCSVLVVLLMSSTWASWHFTMVGLPRRSLPRTQSATHLMSLIPGRHHLFA